MSDEIPGEARPGLRARIVSIPLWVKIAVPVVVVGLVVATIVIAGGGGDEDENIAASRERTVAPTTSTTADTSTSTTTTAAPVTTAPATTVAPRDDAVVVEPTQCLDSFDPRCGEFRWEPTPTNQPVHVDSVVVGPLSSDPTVNGPPYVVVTIQWSDPDADLGFANWTNCSAISYPCPVPAAPRPCEPLVDPPTGPWTPPASTPGAGTAEVRLHFSEAGTFTWVITVGARSSAYLEFLRAHGFPLTSCPPPGPDPYASEMTISDTIIIEEQPPPSSP